MGYAYPSGTNTYVPSFEASGHLVVAFSRNPKDFPLNEWITLTPVQKSSGYFLRITAEQAARVINSSNLAEFVWHDGDDAPGGAWGTESSSWFQFATTRYAYPFRLGYKANEQADWKILAAHSEFAAQDAMTARTVRCISQLLNTGSNGVSTDTATNLGGGFVSAGTSTSPVIKKLLNSVGQKIQLATVGKVRIKDLAVVISPVVADAMGRSAEIHDYVKQSPYALAQIRGDVKSQNGAWGLPDEVYGYRVIVEDCVQVTSRKGATRSASYAMDANKIAIVSRPGELTSVAGGPSFSSVHVFAYEEMTVEQRDDPDNRRISARVVEDFDVQVVSPASTYIVTAALS
jgi:hypothetical protein